LGGPWKRLCCSDGTIFWRCFLDPYKGFQDELFTSGLGGEQWIARNQRYHDRLDQVETIGVKLVFGQKIQNHVQ